MAPSLDIVGKLPSSIFKVYVKERDVLFGPEKYDIHQKGEKIVKREGQRHHLPIQRVTAERNYFNFKILQHL